MDAFPLVGVLGLALDDEKALEDVDDVVNAPSFHGQLLGAAVQVEQVRLLPPVKNEEALAQLSQALFFAGVLFLALIGSAK